MKKALLWVVGIVVCGMAALVIMGFNTPTTILLYEIGNTKLNNITQGAAKVIDSGKIGSLRKTEVIFKPNDIWGKCLAGGALAVGHTRAGKVKYLSFVYNKPAVTTDDPCRVLLDSQIDPAGVLDREGKFVNTSNGTTGAVVSNKFPNGMIFVLAGTKDALEEVANAMKKDLPMRQ